MPDGAPAFEVRNARGELASRIECIADGWYEPDAMAARMLGSTRIMAAVVEKDGRIELSDLGPAVFNCVVVPRPRSGQVDGAARRSPEPPRERRMTRMWTHWLLLAAGLVATLATAQPMPEVTVGRIERLPAAASRHVDPRPVDVWLPADYSTAKRYHVLYMHDGQMLFDASKSWNQQSWNVHRAVDRGVREGRLHDTLIVGVWNAGPLRHSEYFPEKFLPWVAEPLRSAFTQAGLAGQPRADAYLRYLVEELKPAIDARYATVSGPEGTFIMGSSMGGLISLYALCEYPQVFGGAAALSTHWVGTHEANAALPLAAFNYLRDHLPDPATHRLYMDRGTAELDALYGPAQTFVDQLARDRGFTAPRFDSRVFEGASHTEAAWSTRVDIPLNHLLRR
jgi:enterochelin esterase-like enzyme